MKTFFYSLRPAFISMALLTLILGILYPLLVFAVGQLCFKQKANGSLVYAHGKIVGSELIAQDFTRPEYFHPRASSAGTKGYDATNSSGSNLGPTNKKLVEAIKERAAKFRTENNLASQVKLPADAVTTSASGLDPHISLENALLQAPRIALQRSLSLESVHQLISELKETSYFNRFGPSYVNVLKLNLALDLRFEKK